MANITIEIPDQYVNRVLDSFNWITTQKNISYNGDFRPLFFDIEEKEIEENNIVFGKRVIKQLLLNLIKTYELNLDYERYKNEISSLEQPNQNVPEDILL